MKQQTTRNFQGSDTGIIITCVQFYLFWPIDYNIMAPDFISSSL